MNSDYLKKPNLSKKIEQIKGKDFSLTTCEMQGWRKGMQDQQVYTQFQKDLHLFAVLDGHGGPEVAHYAAESLPKELLNEPYFKLGNLPRALTNVFKRIDQLLQSARVEKHLTIINKELQGPPIGPQQKIANRAGTTAVVLLLTKDRYYVANMGDSRAVLCRNGQAIPLSTDHKPEIPSQHNRIEKAGGHVTQGRVNGTLSLSRAFGDFQYKTNEKLSQQQQCVISLPDILEIDRSEDDEFILLGCDGVWQRYVNNNQKMINVLSNLLSKNESSKTAIQKLFNELVAKDGKDSLGYDNMTAQLIQFR